MIQMINGHQLRYEDWWIAGAQVENEIYTGQTRHKIKLIKESIYIRDEVCKKESSNWKKWIHLRIHSRMLHKEMNRTI